MTRAPHLDGEPISIRRGDFFLVGEIIGPEPTVQTGSAYVEWEAPASGARGTPIVLVHGGGGQGTDWKETPDGRAGWADRMVRAGYAVYNFDRPGHGRSSRLVPGGDATLPPLSYEFAQTLWASEDESDIHSAWPWSRRPGGAELDRLMASAGTIRLDAAGGQELDAERLIQLLEMIGPSFVVTHSAGAPAGWLAAAHRPELVRAIVAVEPLGPVWGELPGLGQLRGGIAHAELPFEPPVDDPAVLPDGVARVVPGLVGLPVAVICGEAGFIGRFAAGVAGFLEEVGAVVDLLDLPALGIPGNGHGLIFETNSDQTVQVALDWLSRR